MLFIVASVLLSDQLVMNNLDRSGIVFCVSSYLVWGLVPLVFKYVAAVPDFEVLAHRILWAFLIMIPWVWWRRNRGHLREIYNDKKKLLGLLVTSVLVSSNWLIFIYAVAIGKTLESSFGYFISPLIIVLFGVAFLGEKLGRLQIVSVGLAITGVLYQLIQLGEVPVIALALAGTWATYGLARKTLKVEAIEGLFVEILVFLPLAAGYMFYQSGDLAFFNMGLEMALMLVVAGLVTVLPLWLFTEGNKRIPMSVNGFLQYITPTMHFGCAVLVFGEELNPHKLISFMFVWAGLLVILVGPTFNKRGKQAAQSWRSILQKKKQPKKAAI